MANAFGKTLLWAGVAAIFASCSGGSSSPESAEGDLNDYATAKAIVRAMETKGLKCVAQRDQSGQLYAKDGWACDTKSGQRGEVTAYLFSDSSNRGRWYDVAKGFGG